MKTIDTLNPRIFRKICMSVGELPTSYMESMTYYEMVAWLCEYVKNNVVTTLNNHAEAIKEIQDWIETLDLQDEVDDKIDRMKESGELAEIITQYLEVHGILAFDSVADMKSAENLIDGSFVETYGYYEKGDRGGAKYIVREVTNQDVVDEIRLFALSDENLVAELVIEDKMNTKQFGLKGDGVTDETTLFNAVLSLCSTYEIGHLVISNGTYVITSQLDLGSNINIEGESTNAILKLNTNGDTGANNNYLMRLNGSHNVNVKGVTFSGIYPLSSTTLPTVEKHYGVWLNVCNKVVFENCIFKQFYTSALTIRGVTDYTDDILVTGCTFTHNGWNDIAITKKVNRVKIANNTFTDVVYRGVNAEDGNADETNEDIVVTGNSFICNPSAADSRCITFGNPTLQTTDRRYKKVVVSNNTLTGGSLQITLKYSSDSIVSSNVGLNSTNGVTIQYDTNLVCDGNIISLTDTSAQNAINASNSSNVTIDSNELTGSITLYQSSNGVVSNNTIKRTNSTNGIIISSTTDSIIEGNAVYNVAKGINITAGDRVNVKNNIISGCSDVGIYSNQTQYTVIEGNYIANTNEYGVQIRTTNSTHPCVLFRNNFFDNTTENPTMTVAYHPENSLDYLVIEETYFYKSGIALDDTASRWGEHCIKRNNTGFGTLPA